MCAWWDLIPMALRKKGVFLVLQFLLNVYLGHGTARWVPHEFHIHYRVV